MKWITRANVKVDRVACPWLIRTFIDTEAEFLFVPVDQVESVARETGAIPYDTSGAELGHHGEECSFDAIVKTCATLPETNTTTSCSMAVPGSPKNDHLIAHSPRSLVVIEGSTMPWV